VSGQVFEIFQRATPLVEPLSLDEAYLDVTENAWGETLGVSVARRIKDEIRAVTRLTASAGVAPNKFLAKIASGWQKPDGLTVIPPERVETFLQKLPIDALWGVGPVTARKLRGIGLERLVDVRQADPQRLKQAVGSYAGWLVELAYGNDERPVEPHRERKSVGTENTFASDLTDPEEMSGLLADMAREDADYLDRKGLFARTVTIKVRYADFTTITRSDTREPASRDPEALAARAVALLGRTEAASRPVRLLGVALHGLVEHPLEAPEPLPGTTRPLPFEG
jgi:DNA polymerase-4